MRLNPINCCLRFRLPVTAIFKLTFASNSLYKGAWGFNHTFDVYRLKIGDTNTTMTNQLKLVDDGCCLRNWRQAITDTIDCCVELCKSVSCTLPAQKCPQVHMQHPLKSISHPQNISKYLMSIPAGKMMLRVLYYHIRLIGFVTIIITMMIIVMMMTIIM